MNSPEIVSALVNVFSLMIPEIVLGGAACILFLGATFRADRQLWASVALVALAGAGLALWLSPQEAPSRAAIYAGALVNDSLAIFIKVLALLGGALLVLLSWKDVPERTAAEYYACLLIIIAGLGLVGAANELVTLFLSLELISIPTYVLLYLPRQDNASQEAALKYFLLSIFSSALLLFGFSYLYGLGGTTNLPALMETLSQAGRDGLPGITQVALVMIVAGLAFKITAVPFHFYAPDVYQGTSTAAAALLAFVPKVAGFVALIRVLGYVWAGHAGSGLAFGIQGPMLLYILAAVSMTLGNILALLQDNVKRILAYSGVANAGYMLIGLAVAPDLRGDGMPGGVDAVLFYLVAYGAMTTGAFAVLAYLQNPGQTVETVDDLAGLSRNQPGLAALMAWFLFSLIGIPLTAGFAGKLLLFYGALAATPPLEHPWLFRILATVGVLNAAVAAWYYLRIIAVMYLRDPIRPLARPRSWPGLACVWFCALVTLAFGVVPNPLAQFTLKATSAKAPASLTTPGADAGKVPGKRV
ncbi:MAG TPA: NADH-quinone oxidoreductase subunit N [Gemmataceae bacterium]|nr:NADH-quinone oxidoreductase subunit N [Gemmataceae bacterium]